MIIGYEVRKANDSVIKNGNIARSLVGYMDFMALVNQPEQRAAHRYYVIIGVRAENKDSFWEWFRSFRTIGIISIGLASGPTGNSVLELVEYFDIYIVSSSVLCEQPSHSMFVIISIGELWNRLIYLLSKPDDCLPHKLIIPVDSREQLRVLKAGELFGSLVI